MLIRVPRSPRKLSNAKRRLIELGQNPRAVKEMTAANAALALDFLAKKKANTRDVPKGTGPIQPVAAQSKALDNRV